MQIVNIIHQSVDMMEVIAVKALVIRIMHFIHVVQINHMNASLKIDNIINTLDLHAVIELPCDVLRVVSLSLSLGERE